MFGDLKRSRLITYSAAFIGLIALGSWISIPCIPVPFTLQTLFVLLAGTVMKRQAVIPVAAFIVLGALGLPVFHNGMAGVGVLLGPTGGYLIGFMFAALVVGLAYERKSPYVHIGGLAVGTALILLSGMAWLMYSLGIGLFAACSAGVLPFIIGDLIKGGAAYMIARRLL
ncbi:MAG: biotin transporter BioY [Methanoregula sp.]|nr:biotin transporter BioY [Methanoregula sp.]